MKKIALPTPHAKSEYVAFTGGLDVVTPMSMIPPGFCRTAQNVEEDINGGYASIMGYERFDGHPSPSAAVYQMFTFTVLGSVVVGSSITGATSGATGKVIAINGNSVAMIDIVGVFEAENTTALGATIAAYYTGEALSNSTKNSYTNLAADSRRAAISAVPGAGNILGAWYYKGIVYAFRNTETTGVAMYKSSAAGWTLVNLGYEIAFSNANTSVAEGDTLTQGGVTATVNRVVVETGTLASGTNTGRLIISAPAGGNFAAGAATSTGAGALTLSGVQTAITIPNQNGRFQIVTANFTGSTATSRMYGVDGKNRAFEFDGTVFVPINIGTGIYPSYLVAHRGYLFVGYLSSVLFCGLGNPYVWTTIAGGGEIAIGDTVTGFMPQPGSSSDAALAIYGRDSTQILYGTGVANFTLIPFNDQSGAIPWTMQKVGETFVLDDRGITGLSASQNYGNFAEATISHRVKTWLASKRSLACDSHVHRDKQQYRLFFSDGSACYWLIGKNQSGGATGSMMPMLFRDPVLCSCSIETYGGGEELVFFGSDNGFVYQMERGTSFDGEPIEWFVNLVYNYSKVYRALKKYKRVSFEMTGTGNAFFNAGYSLSYGQAETQQPDTVNNAVTLALTVWDSFIWDSFTWDGTPLVPLSLDTPGDGENISILLSSNSDSNNRLVFSGVLIEFSILRMLR